MTNRSLLDYSGRSIVFDTETTGFPPEGATYKEYPATTKIISFGAVELMDGVPTGREWERFFNPGCSSARDALDVHGITDEFLLNYPAFGEEFISELYYEIFQVGEGIPVRLYAHKSRFDIDMLLSEVHRAGYDADAFIPLMDEIDTRTIFRSVYPHFKQYGLDKIQDHLGVTTKRDKHGALLDTKILAECMAIARRDFGAQAIARLEKDAVLRRSPALPDYGARTPRVLALSAEQTAGQQVFLESLAGKYPVLVKTA